MISSENLTLAISAHGIWKTRLNSAIVAGKCKVDPQVARRDDACEFGRLLKGFQGSSFHRKRAAELHARFHSAVGRVLDAVAAGKMRDAMEMLAAGSEYANISSQLIREMTEWKQELEKG